MSDSGELFDIVVIGGGPAGLTAGLYGARARLKTLVLEHGLPGGQLLLTWYVDNYPGFANGSGADLAANMEKQARAVGCEIRRADVREVRLAGTLKELETDQGTIRAKGVIVASGARHTVLGVPGEKEFTGRGVSYCGTCDGAFFQGVPVVVVGGGDTAVEESIFLTRFASQVTLIHRRDELRAVRSLQDMLFAHPNVEVVWNTVLEAVEGGTAVTGARLRNVVSGQVSVLPVEGVFIFVGIKPNSEFLQGAVAMDESGFIRTDACMRTNVERVLACGDVRSKEMRQITNAVGEGATSAWVLEKMIRDMGKGGG